MNAKEKFNDIMQIIEEEVVTFNKSIKRSNNMSNSIRIGIGDYEAVEEAIEAIIQDENSNGIDDRFLEHICEVGKDNVQNYILGDLGSMIKQVHEYYNSAPRIVNPEAVKRISILRKTITEAVDIIDDKDISIKESIENALGWDYTLTISCTCVGFAGNVLNLFKIAMLACDSVDISCGNKEDEVVLFLTINDVYKVIK